MKEFVLNNGIKAVYRQNKNTPRIGLSFNFSINDEEKIPGTYCLISRLLLQGTKNRNCEQLANELDENAIEFSCDMKQDYLRFRFVCLNEDFELANEIMADIIKNSTFEEFEKEKTKLHGEIIAELDSAKTKALDNYYKTIFANHFYGHTYTTILEHLDKITKQDVMDAYQNILLHGEKVLSIVGDIDFDHSTEIINKLFADLSNVDIKSKSFATPILKESKTVEIIKPDAQQAQIIQGWIMPTLTSEDYPALVLLNIMLGSAGLSSRLFLELREKKGLAYTVRSTYEANEKCANLSIYIATEPKNIDICLSGFKEEIGKFKTIPVSEQELSNAKNNLIGKQQFVTETNAQQANLLCYYGIMKLGFDFQSVIIEKIKKVNVEDIQKVACKYFNENSVTSILKP